MRAKTNITVVIRQTSEYRSLVARRLEPMRRRAIQPCKSELVLLRPVLRVS